MIDELARCTFTAPERWGWQYVKDDTPITAVLDPKPTWDPTPPSTESTYEYETQVAWGRKQGFIWFLITIGLIVTTIGVFRYIALRASIISPPVSAYGIPISPGNLNPVELHPTIFRTAACVCLVSAVVRLLYLRNFLRRTHAAAAERLRRLEETNQQRLMQESKQYLAQVANWQEKVDLQKEQIRREQEARDQAPVWFPIQPTLPDRRLDVFGGDGGRDGWSHLLATMGTSLLASGRSIGLLDLTGMDVGSSLERLATSSGTPCRRLDLPNDLGGVDLLHGLSPDELAELVSRAVGAERPADGDGLLNGLRADILRTVTLALAENAGAEHGFARLVAGVQVLRRTNHDSPLTQAEQLALGEQVNRFTAVRAAGDELYFLEVRLNALAAAAEPERVPFWSPDGNGLFAHTGLGVVSTSPDAHSSVRKKMLDLLLVLLAKRSMAIGGADAFPDVLIVASADSLGGPLLEELSDQCRRSRVRLVLLLEHLRDDLNALIGSGSTVLLMQLGNDTEAQAAATFIGRGHKFVLSGITYEDGSSTNTGGEEGTGGQSTTGSSYSRHSGTTTNESRTGSWSRARTWGQSTSKGTSEAHTRVQELLVEPHVLQTLPPTAFILVDNAAGVRRVVSGDCNPGIALRAGQVSAIPYRAG